MSLNNVVVDALTRFNPYQGQAIWTVENHAKYSTLKNAAGHQQDHRINHQIFMLMRALNEQGISTNGLCADAQGHGSLKSLLAQLTQRLVHMSRGKRVHYVELGPEPVKTSYILTQIAQAATAVRYTAIDINATSEGAMRDAVIPIIADPANFNYLAADYRTVTHDTLRHDQDLTLITMLGFQEGNESPLATGRLIQALADDTTCIISEMQVYEEGLEHCIHAFYANPHMLSFSQLIARQQGFVPVGDHETTLLRLTIAGELLHIAVTLQPVEHLQKRGYLLTNSCIKYTPDQFRRVRSLHGNCTVLDELVSGDGSVRYQIAQYLPPL
ncbi:hypothetical protein [Pseudomonas lundensis]|uniref:hypothetical protein n=1 Tax=Pseudomonas lundensis TaxID=86185 RepID=UPI001472D19E|nr:hypothetical protein [Pseudomonas lundensis]NMZ97646.1 hypothetical protein [Pseudomonas lundensis]